MRLERKVAIVTGAAGGIGRAIATHFAAEGAAVVLADQAEAEGRALEAAIQAAGGKAIFLAADVGSEADCARAVRTAVDAFGTLTTLVNNAAATHLVGLAGRGDTDVTQLSDAVLTESLRTNVCGLVWCCKHAVPRMIEAGGGSIVNISSGVALRGAPGMDAYTASKGAVNALTRSMAVQYAHEKVRVNCIVPGLIRSGKLMDATLDDPAQHEWLERAVRLPYFGTPDDVAWGAVYLASDEARYVTGIDLPIDGGYLA
jgi:3-oxoacyl-[acyl-carrier protein] reductase